MRISLKCSSLSSPYKFPGLLSVFWPISTMLQFGWSSLVLQFPTFPASLAILRGLFCAPQLQLVSLSLIPPCFTVFFGFFSLVLWQSLDTYLSFRFLWCSLSGLPGRQSTLFGWSSLMAWIRFVSQNPRKFCMFHSPRRILVFSNTIS